MRVAWLSGGPMDGHVMEVTDSDVPLILVGDRGYIGPTLFDEQPEHDIVGRWNPETKWYEAERL